MRHRFTAVAGALLATAMFAGQAQAQNVSYTTSGTFSGSSAGFCTVGPAPVCTAPGFVLAYDPAFQVNQVPNVGGTVNLGNFFLTATGPTTNVAPGQLFFTLAIAQSTPTVGTGSTTGSITGTVQNTGGSFSTLVFAPTNQTVTIGGTMYTLIYDEGTNGIRIAFNGGDIPNTTAIKATLTQTTATPEPASMVLLGTGLVGVFGAARRRRKVVVA